MQKRKLSSSTTKGQLYKKAKPAQSKVKDSLPAKSIYKLTSKQSYTILDYMKCSSSCSKASGSCSLTAEKNETELFENQVSKGSSVERTVSKQPTAYSAYCPRCQMPALSFDDLLFQEHVLLCVERVFDFEGPCPHGSLCNEHNSDHFKTYNHNLLAKKRSCLQNNKPSSEVQTNKVKIAEKVEIVSSSDPVGHDPSIKSNTFACTKTSPLKKFAHEMKYIHRFNHHFSMSLLNCEEVNSDGNKFDKMKKCNSVCEKIASRKKDDKKVCLDVDCAGDENGKKVCLDVDCAGDENGTGIPITKNQDLDDESSVLFSEQDDNDDDDHKPINKIIPQCQSLDSLIFSADDDDDDELLANIGNSDDISISIPPKLSLSPKHLIDNECSKVDTLEMNSIPVTEKEHCLRNKHRTVNNPTEKCITQACISTSSKQSDIGTYFGLNPLKKAVEQSNIQHKMTDETLNVGSNNSSFEGKRKCPFYKKIPGTPFVVDAFNFGTISGVKAYFLSHFHYDHYKGLTARFSKTIYCSKITANLVKSRIRVSARFIKELPMNTPMPIDKVLVTLLEANHCPGAVLFLFELPTGENYLHTGDFRASPSMEKYTVLRSKHINSLFLDTTYCKPAYIFPSQEEMVQFAVKTALQAKKQNPRTLIVCGTYTIGKEKVFFAIAEALRCKVSVTREKKKTLDCFESDVVSSLVTTDWNASGVHVLRMKDLQIKALKSHLNKFKHCYNELLAFKPTGWEHNAGGTVHDILPSKSGPITTYGVPYSEHSSYKELERFVKFIKPDKIIPTVNVHSLEQRAILNSWISNKKVKC